jgi:hypothetical protein
MTETNTTKRTAPSACIRCGVAISEKSGLVGSCCSACDLELQEMHHACEYIVDKKVVYITDKREVEYLSQQFTGSERFGWKPLLRKKAPPYRRDFYGNRPAASRPIKSA